MHRMKVVTLVLSLTSGCTHWGTQTNPGATAEVARILRGSPQVATTSTASLSGGAAGVRGTNSGAGAIAGSGGMMSRTHCVQEAELSFAQQLEIVPVVESRGKDIALAAVIGGLGILLIAAGAQPRDGGMTEPALSSTQQYAAGGVMVLGGGLILGYSLFALPKGPRPEVQRTQRTWSVVELVEATGCGLPGETTAKQPGSAPGAAPTGDAAARIEKLDKLRAAGTITEAEYQAKRKQILDEI